MATDPNKIRDMIQQILIDHNQTGSPDYKDCNEIASSIGVEYSLVEAHLDVLAEEGHVELVKTFGGCAARITSRALIYHDRSIRQTLAGVPTEEVEEKQKEASDFLAQAFKELSKADYTYKRDLEPSLMKVQHAARLLNWTRALEMVTGELMGPSSEQELPAWRNVQETVYYEPTGILQPVPAGLKQHQEPFSLYNSMSSIINAVVTDGFKREEVTQFSSGDRVWNVKEIRVIEVWKLEDLLSKVRQAFFSFCSNSIKQLRFGKSVDSLFEQYRQAVEAKLGKLDIAGHLETAVHNLNRQNPESWRAAALGCRNILSDLAKKLWQAPDSSYPYLNNMPLKGGATDLVNNRLRAWLHQKGLRKSDNLFIEKRLIQLSDSLGELYALASKGKQSIKYEDALCCVINTYILLGEIAIRTDLEPVTQIQKIGE